MHSKSLVEKDPFISNSREKPRGFSAARTKELWREKLCYYWCDKAKNHIHVCVTDRHGMTLAVKVVLNPNTTNQPIEPRTLDYESNTLPLSHAGPCNPE